MNENIRKQFQECKAKRKERAAASDNNVLLIKFKVFTWSYELKWLMVNGSALSCHMLEKIVKKKTFKNQSYEIFCQ